MNYVVEDLKRLNKNEKRRIKKGKKLLANFTVKKAVEQASGGKV